MTAASEAVAVRRARLEDAEGIARVQSDCWRTTYAGLVPDRVLVRMTPKRQARLWRSYLRNGIEAAGIIYVARAPDDGVVGFASCGPEQTGRYPETGEVYTLYVAESMHGRGLGRRLLRAMFARLRRDGFDSALIWVLDGNPARYFYESLGGVLAAQRTSQQWGVTIAESAYMWRSLSDYR